MTNTKNTKRALLASTLALILCFSMLLGTTYAWFTDSVTSGNNVITSGNLDAVLEYKTAWDEEWTPVTANTKLFNDEALYEPGYTEVIYLRVSNAGTLAFKYNLVFNLTNEVAGTNVYGESFKLSDYLEFGSYRMDEYNGEFNYADILFPTMFGTREAALKNAPMATLSKVDPRLATNAPVLAGDYTSQVFALVLSMPTTVGNEANAKLGTTAPSFNFNVSMLATQLMAEDDSFGADYDKDAELPASVTNATEIAEALTANEENIEVILANDIDLPISSLGQITGGSGEYKLGGEDTESIVIDLNGHKLNITTTYWSNLGAKNPNATFTIKNGEMTSSQPTGTWNSYDLTFSNCNYVFENVIFDKAVAFDNAGKSVEMNNVTINETHDYYALWICAAGIDVEINGLTVNSDGRGIKIDEQYIDAPAKVTLSITDAVFNTAKKAAIIVKSAAGADITLNNVSIANVAADPFNAVWVDEDAAAYANLVTVTGGTVVVEGSADAPTATTVAAGTTVSMDNNIFTAGGKTVINNAGTITISKPNLNGGDVVINGGAVKGSGYATGVQHVNTVTYNNVTVIGEMCLYGEKVVFNNCTFELNNQYVWTYGAKEVEFNNCTFNTNGKAILVYNEGAGASKVTVKGCTFNATAGAKAGAIANQNCAAIEIDNFQSSGTGVAHVVITENNTYSDNFSGEWRIKNYVNGGAITVNGDEYTQIAVDGKLMTIDANKNVTVAN